MHIHFMQTSSTLGPVSSAVKLKPSIVQVALFWCSNLHYNLCPELGEPNFVDFLYRHSTWICDVI